MERGTLASGSDLTWILPHWLNCFLSVPLGDTLVVCVCARARTCAHVNGWSLWMKTLLPERQTGGEIIGLKWRIPPPTNPLTRPPMLLGANLNESHQWAARMKHTVATWLIAVPSNISFPWQRRRAHSRVHWHRHTEAHTDIDTHIPVIFHQKSKRMSLPLLVFGQYDVETECQLALLPLFTFLFGTELSGFDDWPPIQQCASGSDND